MGTSFPPPTPPTSLRLRGGMEWQGIGVNENKRIVRDRIPFNRLFIEWKGFIDFIPVYRPIYETHRARSLLSGGRVLNSLNLDVWGNSIAFLPV